MNTKNTAPKKVGRPAFEITYPRGAFTLKQLHAANPKAKWLLTIRQHVEKELEAGKLVKITDFKSGKVGKPAHRFIRAAVWAAIQARKSPAKVAVPVEGPAPEASTPVEAHVLAGAPEVSLVETPAIAETAPQS